MKQLFKILKTTFLCIGILALIVAFLFGYKDIPLDELKAKYAKAPSSFVSVDGINVHFRDEGDLNTSVPIVLIHGTGSSLHTFDDWTDSLKTEYRVIRMDLPGYGLTDPFPKKIYSVGNYTSFVKQFLDKKGIKKCVIGGNSLGGHIAWRFTANYPNMVEKMILIDAAGYPYKAKSLPLAFRIAKIPLIKNLFKYITPKFVARSSIENVYADKSKVTDELTDRYFELTLRPGNRQAFVDRLSIQNNSDTYKQIPSILQPTLILWGEQDLLIPVENAKLFHKDLPNNTFVVLKNVGHVPMEESPNQSLEAVISFLENMDFY
ncbi:MAG: alpha/beta hydrolase [Flavobacteriaceae bacterium]|jgi:pimeloyl-ACP methyl ester carboxylesterase|nr:alpha/beta hydrolase [Flavobacteriaceae bacterium]MDA7728406.1 alpha/beta hydrolase [Flavobacteriaceae bacterium]MDA7848874.1 alpha/beta hydrolase [Flavobacteriaceae bacterium]MDG1309044.1 alpha/beta hydrolase [Flavobacteriaceae bacterium]